MIDRFLFWLKRIAIQRPSRKYIFKSLLNLVQNVVLKSNTIQFVELREIKCQIFYVFTKL